jgi:dihydrofolate synthase/folylpolyglutamate synthase
VSPPASDAVLERLMALHPKLIDLKLDRVEDMLARLGNPERKLAPVVHVAGTNAKGSVLAYMRAALEAAGKRVHVYTSPHLVRFHERIRLAGELIAESELTKLLEECEAANEGRPITFFEITTAAAFLAFARMPADVVLLETGLGGRLDATNLIAKPRLTIITPVSLDHQQFLGNTLAEIAGEKAGILKPGVACVLARQEPAARAVIRARAEALGAPVLEQGVDWSVRADGGHLHYHERGVETAYPLPVLPGAHQIDNAGTAIAALRHLGDLTPDDAAVAAGLETAIWPARLQRLTKGSLVEKLPDDWELWLDGGHNPAAGEMLALHAAAKWRDRPLHLVSGMLNSKAAGDFLKPLAGVAADLATVTIPGEANSFTADQLAEMARGAGMAAVRTSVSVADAVDGIVSKATGRPERILVCGSLYLAGRVLADNA